jgi:type II secretory pathway pseudopilin PulG
MKKAYSQSGFIMLTVLIMAFVLSSLGMIAAESLISNARFNQFEARSAQAMNISEAGVNYYLWHMSHNPSDYKDGGSTPTVAPFGPYVHNYYDTDGNFLGTYTLYITPPSNGSTIATIKSIGQVPNFSGTRTILAQLGQPSFSNYIFLGDTDLNFSPTTTTTGPVHSNGCVQFDGTNNGPVTSAKATCLSGSVGGVHGAGGPKSQWQYPVSPISFSSVTANLNTLQTASQTAAGIYLGASGGIGWSIVLKADGTLDVYKVTNENSGGITQTFVSNKAAPSNGVVFSPENVWISGTNWPGRITIVAAKLPDNAATRKSINIIGNLTYAGHTGQNAIGLIAQQDVFVPQYVPNTMNVDAAVLAQYGSVGYDTANGGLKTSFTLYGAIAQSQNAYGFKSTGCGSYCSGFPTTAYNFDSNLIYAPPPMFPTTGNYSVLNWREQLYNP